MQSESSLNQAKFFIIFNPILYNYYICKYIFIFYGIFYSRIIIILFLHNRLKYSLSFAQLILLFTAIKNWFAESWKREWNLLAKTADKERDGEGERQPIVAGILTCVCGRGDSLNLLTTNVMCFFLFFLNNGKRFHSHSFGLICRSFNASICVNL